MSDQFLGEIRIVPYTFAPEGWALCNGQTLAISQNTALFSVLGVQYGGNGTSTFLLPNLQGMAAIAAGQGAGLSTYSVASSGGLSSVTLTQQTLPAHSHTLPVSTGTGMANLAPSPGSYLAASAARGGTPLYATPAEQTGGPATMLTTAVGPAGTGVPHNNMPPYVVLSFIIALIGIFPPRS